MDLVLSSNAQFFCKEQFIHERIINYLIRSLFGVSLMTKLSHILIVEARFYPDIANQLLLGAKKQLSIPNVRYETISVPGVYEIPAALNFGIKSKQKNFDGFITLGCVIRGETDHYKYICQEAVRKMMDFSVNNIIAFGFGVLTVDNYDQAYKRANSSNKKNIGGNAAISCLEMIKLRQYFNLPA